MLGEEQAEFKKFCLGPARWAIESSLSRVFGDARKYFEWLALVGSRNVALESRLGRKLCRLESERLLNPKAGEELRPIGDKLCERFQTDYNV